MREAFLATPFKLRPEPGSRVTTHTPAHTQGAGVPIIGAPVKGLIGNRRRIEHPPSACNLNVDRELRRRVTKL